MTTNSQSKADERRRHQRFPHGDLEVRLHRVGLRSLLSSPPVARCEDFSLSGLQVICTSNFNVGDRVAIDLKLHTESVQELVGIICSRRDADDGSHYGVRFCFEKGGHMKSTEVNHGLRRIASELRQSWVYDQNGAKPG